MRGSGWIVFVGVAAVWLACIFIPSIAIFIQIFSSGSSDVEVRSTLSLILTSIGWAVAMAAVSVVIGWLPGQLLGKALAQANRRAFVPLAALILVPICLPSYVVFYAWWQSWPADSAFHQWVVEHGLMQFARQATLFISLVCWSWPLASLCVAGVAATVPAQREELLLIDGAGIVRRWIDRLRCDMSGLMIGGLLVSLATLANTTCFDLAEVFTYANELRAMQSLGATGRDVLIASLPMMAISAAGALIVWRSLRPSRGGEIRASLRVRPMTPIAVFAFAALWAFTVVVPLALFVRNVVKQEQWKLHIANFVSLYGDGAVNTVLIAAVSASVGAILAVGFTAAWLDHRAYIHRIAKALAITWMAAAFIPGTILGMALLTAYNRVPFEQSIAMTPVILVLGHLMSFGFIPALMGRWAASREPQQLRDLRRVDGAQSLIAIAAAARPRFAAAAIASFAAVFVLGIGEITITALTTPPYRAGAGPLAITLLNDMHYQRPQTVMVASVGMMLMAVVAAVTLAAIAQFNAKGARQ